MYGASHFEGSHKLIINNASLGTFYEVYAAPECRLAQVIWELEIKCWKAQIKVVYDTPATAHSACCSRADFHRDSYTLSNVASR